MLTPDRAASGGRPWLDCSTDRAVTGGPGLWLDCSTVESAREALARLNLSAPELAAYQDEPPQMASGGVGKNGYLRLRFERDPVTGRTELADMDRRVPLLVQKALYWDESVPDMACVTSITTTGCLVQGDRMAMDVHAGPGARALITTQAATKVHSMEKNYASQIQRFAVEEGAYLEYMPDPLILHRTARYVMDTSIVLPESATFLYGEILVPGRRYHHRDELFGFDLYSSGIRASREISGEPLFVERFVLDPKSMDFRRAGVMGDLAVFGNVVLLTPERHIDPLREGIGADADGSLAWGATVLPHHAGLLFKVLGATTEKVRAKIREFHDLVRRAVLGAPLPAPFLWR